MTTPPTPTPPLDAGAAAPQRAELVRRVSRRWPLVSAAVLVVLVAALSVILAFRPTEPFALDTEWMSEIIEHRSAAWEIPALVMDFLGAGVVGVYVIPLGILAALLVLRRRWAALFFGLSVVASAGVVQLLKNLVDRARPEDMLVTSDFGSFPSGHSANAATTALVLAIIFPRVGVWIAGALYTLAMMASRTYLGAHWLSDTVGGLLLGTGVAVIIWAPLASRLQREVASRAPAI